MISFPEATLSSLSLALTLGDMHTTMPYSLRRCGVLFQAGRHTNHCDKGEEYVRIAGRGKQSVG